MLDLASVTGIGPSEIAAMDDWTLDVLLQYAARKMRR